MVTAHSVHPMDLVRGDHLPHGNRVLGTRPGPGGTIEVEVAFASGVHECFRYKPEEWITIVRDTEEEE